MTALVCSFKAGLNDSVELRYSLRSIEANLVHQDIHLVLVGDEPPAWLEPDLWVRGNVMPEETPGWRQVAVNVLLASQMIESSTEQAVYIDDDYFLLDPTSEILPTHGGGLREHAARCKANLRPGHWYVEAMQATAGLFEHEPEAKTFELHRPMPFIPSKAIVHVATALDQGTLWRSTYGNLADDIVPPVFARDGRYVGSSLPIGVPWVSSEDRAWATGLGKKIAGMFPKASRWER